MSGLLDALGSDQGLLGLALMSAGSAKPVRTGLGEGLLGALQMVQANKAQQEDRKQRAMMLDLQRQNMEASLGDRKRQQELMGKRDQYLASIDPNQGPPMEATLPGAIRAGLSAQEFGMLAPQAQRPEYKVVGGALVQIGPDGVKEAYRAPASASEKTSPIGQLMAEMNALPPDSPARKIYQQAINKATQHPPGVSVSYGAPVAGVDSGGNPVFFQPAKGGGAPAIIPGVAPPKKDMALTEAQAKAATYKSQMESAEKELSGTPIDQTKLASQADVAMASGATNILASPAAQRARQAQEQWSEAFLRFKTGAAATTDEVRLNVRTFFPQPGDSVAVIEQKKRMRQQAAQDISFAAGQKSTPNAATPDNDPLGLRGK